MRNSIVAGEEASKIIGTAPCSLDYSLVQNSDGSAVTVGDGVILDADPLLGPLQDNGDTSWTWTHAPASGSLAIDAGEASITTPDHDQRGAGFPRIQGAALDLGSFESATEMTDALFKDRFEDES